MTENESTFPGDTPGDDFTPTPAQRDAARGRYEDVQASTGGDSKTPPRGAEQNDGADHAEGSDIRAEDGATRDPLEERMDIPDGLSPEDIDALKAPGAPSEPDQSAAGAAGMLGADGDSAAAQLAAERLADLQRLQAEYVNYKRRVDRDRAVDSQRAVAGVVESLLPVMDEIHLARQHGELEGGPFAKIAEKFEGILGRHGVERFGAPGEAFDPTVHEAVMNVQADLPAGTTETTVVQVMQPGYRIGERVVRPALVSVADPA